ALRRRFHRRVRRTYADDRLHDRQHGGGVLMAAATVGERVPANGAGPIHGLRIFLVWLPIALIADYLLYFVYGPHMPPGQMSTSAASQQFDIKVMSVMAAPVMAFVLVYGVYAVGVLGRRDGDDEDGPAIHGHTRIQ